MATTTDTTIAVLRSGHDELAALVRDLGPTDLTRPSGASEWQVSQVLSHLGSGAEINEASLDAALGGRPAPDDDFNKQVWARWDAMTPIEQAEGFIEANRRLVERYESLDAATRSSVRIEFGSLPAPVDLATVVGIRLSEFALHEWDVEVAFNRYAAVAPEAVPLLLDRLDGLFGWIGRPDAVEDRPLDLAVRLTDPDRSLGLRFADRIEVVELPEQPAGEIAGPAEAFLRMTAGRLAPEHTPDAFTVTGRLDLADLRRIFPGY